MKITDKNTILGMPTGTASNRLRKILLFHFVKKSGMDLCYRCKNKIESVDEFTIDHKEPWLHVSKDLFWNIDNIAFSHLKCNVAAKRVEFLGNGGRKLRKIGEPGTAWCSTCRAFKEINLFSRNKKRWNGYSSECKICDRNRKIRKRQTVKE